MHPGVPVSMDDGTATSHIAGSARDRLPSAGVVRSGEVFLQVIRLPRIVLTERGSGMRWLTKQLMPRCLVTDGRLRSLQPAGVELGVGDARAVAQRS